jgi:crotonobetainyl-CoA:carnitine CoA-transferase CaiB-like acyl-CoA transferase
MAGHLDGMLVAVDARDRRVMLAASWLAELGATVHVVGDVLPGDGPGGARDIDRAWVGAGGLAGGAGVAGAPVGGTEVDLVIVAGGTPARTVHDGAARCTVTLHGTPPGGPLGGRDVDERELAARAGLAVAIGLPDRDPLPMPEGVLDTMVAMHLVSAGLAGLLEGAREAEVVATDAIAHAVIMNSNLFVPFGRPWRRAGTRASQSGGAYPYAVLRAADGQVVLIGRTDADWHNLVAAAGEPEWARDPRFADPVVNGRDHAEELDGLFEASWLSHRTREQVLRDAERHRFAAGPVLTPLEVLEDPILAPLWRPTTLRGREVRTPGAPFRTRRNGPGGRGDRPLAGCLVLDLSWVWSGPGAGAAMADLGAIVVKVESRTRPDNTRLRRGLPPGRVADDAPRTEISPYFHGMNRGKRSLTLDVKQPGGRALLQAMSERADVILENLTPGVMTRAGIDADQVAARNPGCVHVSMRGYSDHPSTRDLRGYAPVMSARAGIEHLIAYPDGTRTGAMTYGHSDASAVAQALTLMLAGLWSRRRHGAGSSTTLFQNEGVVWANGHNLLAAQLGAERPLEPIVEHRAVTFEELDGSDAVSPGMLRHLPHRWLGEVVASALPFRLDGVRPAPTAAGPAIGEHTHELLRDVLGLDDATIARHEAEGALE